MIESGSVCGIITKMLADNILKTTPSARWVASETERDLKTFSNEPIKALDKNLNDWICEDACLIVVEEGQKSSLEGTCSVVLAWQWCNNKQKRVNMLTILTILHAKINKLWRRNFPILFQKFAYQRQSSLNQSFIKSLQRSIRKVVKFRLINNLELLQTETNYKKKDISKNCLNIPTKISFRLW